MDRANICQLSMIIRLADRLTTNQPDKITESGMSLDHPNMNIEIPTSGNSQWKRKW